MNCQITKIYFKYIELQIISSKHDFKYPISSIVRISQNEYFLDDEKSQSLPSESFAFINQIGHKSIRLELFQPEQYIVGKIIKIEPIQNKFDFTPEIITGQLISSQNPKSNTTNNGKLYEFIPTVLVNEEVLVGQKIGYINIKSNNQFKYWILSESTGIVNKIELGEFHEGNSIAVINKQNHILGSTNQIKIPGDLLLKLDTPGRSINLNVGEVKLNQKLHSTLKNCIINEQKKFLNSIKTEFENGTVLIFFTSEEKFIPPKGYTCIKILDKFGFGAYYEKALSDLALSICESGNSVVVISDIEIKIRSIGGYKNVNGEEIFITSVFVSDKKEIANKHFDHVITLD